MPELVGIQNAAGEFFAHGGPGQASFEAGVTVRTIRYAPEKAAAIIAQLARNELPTIAAPVPLTPLTEEEQRELTALLNPPRRRSRRRPRR